MLDWQKKIEATRRFRDPIYGYVWLTDEEVRIVDSPLFQRLRRVNQLSLTKYVYPTAEHSRFVHSLGAVHCSTLMFAGICGHKDSSFSEADVTRCLKLLRYAALLHDVGHLPFSHGAEEELLKNARHEDISIYLIKEYKPFCDVLEEDVLTVASILASNVKNKYWILHEIISGQLDADRADYLMRDSYFCGVKYGEYDLDRYMQSFGAIQTDDGMRMFVNERDIYVVESFLIARYHYNLQVPFHRTRVGYDFALKRYFRGLVDENDFEYEDFIKEENGTITNIDFKFFEYFDDYRIFEQIKIDSGSNKWARILLRGEHLYPVFDETNSIEENEEKYKAIVLKLSESDLVENDDYFCYAKRVKFTKFDTEKENELESGGERSKSTIYVKTRNGSYVDITQYSKLIQRLNHELRILRIYATIESKPKVEQVVAACN